MSSSRLICFVIGLVFMGGMAKGQEAVDQSLPAGNAENAVDSDLAKLSDDKEKLVERLLFAVENEIVPLTRKGVRSGNKLFGGAVLKKSDLSTVVAVTNAETGNPLMHGEITAIHAFYEIPRGQRPPARDCLFLCTHEPCPLCLAGITWAGFDNFFYLFSYEDSRDAFKIPHDLRIHEEVFGVKDGNYAQKNHYWSSWSIQELIDSCAVSDRQRFKSRVRALYKTYDGLSKVYQQSKKQGAEIPLN